MHHTITHRLLYDYIESRCIHKGYCPSIWRLLLAADGAPTTAIRTSPLCLPPCVLPATCIPEEAFSRSLLSLSFAGDDFFELLLLLLLLLLFGKRILKPNTLGTYFGDGRGGLGRNAGYCISNKCAKVEPKYAPSKCSSL